MFPVSACRGAVSTALIVLSVAVISSCTPRPFQLVSSQPACQDPGFSYVHAHQQLYGTEVPQQASSSQLAGSVLEPQPIQVPQQVESNQAISGNTQQALGIEYGRAQQQVVPSQQVPNLYTVPQQGAPEPRYGYSANQQVTPESEQGYAASNQIYSEPQQYISPRVVSEQSYAVAQNKAVRASQRVCATPEHLTVATQRLYSVPSRGCASQRVCLVQESAVAPPSQGDYSVNPQPQEDYREPADSSLPLRYPPVKQSFAVGRQSSKGGRRPIITIKPAGKAFFIECN